MLLAGRGSGQADRTEVKGVRRLQDWSDGVGARSQVPSPSLHSQELRLTPNGPARGVQAVDPARAQGTGIADEDTDAMEGEMEGEMVSERGAEKAEGGWGSGLQRPAVDDEARYDGGLNLHTTESPRGADALRDAWNMLRDESGLISGLTPKRQEALAQGRWPGPGDAQSSLGGRAVDRPERDEKKGLEEERDEVTARLHELQQQVQRNAEVRCHIDRVFGLAVS